MHYLVIFKTVVVQSSMEPNAAIGMELPSAKVIELHYVLFAWRSVGDLAVTSGW